MADSNSQVTFEIDALLDLFDTKQANKGITSPINSILGEDLGAALFMNHLRNNDSQNSEIIYDTIKEEEDLETDDLDLGNKINKAIEPTGDHKKKLDRWIRVENTFYQTEIKNWNSNSANVFQHNINDSNVHNASKDNFKRYFFHKDCEKVISLQYMALSKVLLKMTYPNNYNNKKIKPALVFWFPIFPNQVFIDQLGDNFIKINEYMFDINFNLEKHGCREKEKMNVFYKELTVFSMSLYLRFLKKMGQNEIELHLPWFNETIEILRRIGAIKEPKNNAVNNISINIYN